MSDRSTDERPTVDYDHHRDGNLWPVWKQLREQCPVAFSEAHGGHWVTSKYADIAAIARNPGVFSSEFVTVPPMLGVGEVGMPPLTSDPPDHGPLKGLLTSAFTPKRMALIEPLVREIVASSIDAFADRGWCEASAEFCKIVPMYTIARLLGLPTEDDATFTDWVHRMVEMQGTDESFEAGFEIMEYFSELLPKRQANRGEDFISYLTTAEVDGHTLDDSDIILSSMSVLLAGIDTTWSTLAHALWHLAQDQDLQQRLRDEPALLDTAKEEFLRFYAPVSVARVAKTDTEVGGCPVAAGELVMIPFPSANRDPEEFADPDTFDATRSPNRHVAFGLGIHRCVGVNLARLELSIALGEFLRRVPPFRLDPDHEITWAVGQIRGPRSLRLLFDAA
jgi:cytochrome P450